MSYLLVKEQTSELPPKKMGKIHNKSSRKPEEADSCIKLVKSQRSKNAEIL